MIRRALIAFLAFGVLTGMHLTDFGGGSNSPSPPPTDPLATLLNNMAAKCPATGGHNCWVKLSGPNQGSLQSAYTPKFPDAAACNNYEGMNIAACQAGTNTGGTFLNAAAVRAVVGNGGNNDTGFSAQMVDVKHRVLHFTGGGHPSHPPDNPILRFDLNAAAASINAEGPGGVWQVAPNADAGRLILCGGTFAAPVKGNPCTDNGWRPSWSNQGGNSYPGNASVYWEGVNNEGYPVPISGHTYYTGIMVGAIWTYASYGSGYPTSTLPGSIFGYDEANQHPVGPFTIKPDQFCGASINCMTDNSYSLSNTVHNPLLITNPAVNPQNNLVYILSDSNGLFYFSDPVGPNITGHNAGAAPMANIRVNESKKPANIVFIPDPFHTGKECVIQVWKTNVYYGNPNGTWSGACNISADNSTTPTAMIQAFQNPLPASLQSNPAFIYPMECNSPTGTALPCYNSVYQSYDAVNDILWMTGPLVTDSSPAGTLHGAFLYQIIRSSDPTKWNIKEVANQNSGGDVPYSLGVGVHVPVVETIQTVAGPGEIYTDNADVWIYNP